jgi:hypothetical protein
MNNDPVKEKIKEAMFEVLPGVLLEALPEVLSNHLSEKFEKIDRLNEKIEDVENKLFVMEEDMKEMKEEVNKINVSLMVVRNSIEKEIKERYKWIQNAYNFIKANRVVSYKDLRINFPVLRNGDVTREFERTLESEDIYVVNVKGKGNPKIYIHCMPDEVEIKKLIDNWGNFFRRGVLSLREEFGFDDKTKNIIMEFVKLHLLNWVKIADSYTLVLK